MSGINVMNTKAVWRPTMSSDVVFELVDLLEHTKRTTGLSSNLRAFLSKLDSLAYDIGKGNRSPAYVATGAREKSAISIESLGGTQDEADHTLRNLATIPVTNSMLPAKPSENLNESEEEELARLEREMLAELSAQGNENVIMEERRKVPRNSLDSIASVDISKL